MQINVYRNGTVQATFEADLNTVFTQQIMGEHKVTAYFFAPAPLDVQLGDYIIVSGDNFYINFVPTVQKVNNFSYHHTITFEAEIYKLYNKIFMDEGAAEFSYFGGPLEFVQLLVDNLNEIEAGWAVGNVDDADGQNLQFSGNDCRTALTNIAQAFKMEYSLSGKAVNLVLQIGNTSTLQFEYGRGKGLYSLTRQNIDSVNVVTRAYGFGGQKNIDYNYRNGAPFGSAQGTKRLIFASKYLEANIALYGIREGSITFDDIFPQRTGGVTAINATDIFQFTDSGLDFDINAQLMEGVTAAVIFKTGALAGYQFDILSYDNTNKIVRFKAFTDSNDYVLPNSLNKPTVGDIYTLVNISMPQTYIDAAETLLQQKTQEYLNQNSVPRVTYALVIDEKFVRDNGVLVKVGDKVTVIDAALGLNAMIRVSQLEFPLANPAAIKATIADTIAYTIQERLISKTVDNAKVIKRVDVTRSEASRINAMRTRQLQNLVFDPDGYFDAEHIKPESIETLMLSVGAKSQDFNLSGVTIQPNAGGNANALTISAGELIHHEIEIEGLGYTWEMSGSTTLTNQLDPAKAYYVYAKCSATQLTGTWETSETGHKVDDEAGYYLFNLGMLYAVTNGRRDFAFTNGMTFISGDNVTTGRIQDLSKQNYLDLNSGQMNLGSAMSGLDWDVSKADTLTIRGGLVQNAGGITSEIGVYRGDYNSSATYYKGDTVLYNGSTYRWISDANGSGITPGTDATKWKISAAKGIVARTIYNTSDDPHDIPVLDVNNSDAQGWIVNMPASDLISLLTSDGGDTIVTDDGVEILIGAQTKYVWTSQEQLDASGNFVSWSAPTRLTGLDGIAGNYTEMRWAVNGSETTPPSVDKTNPSPAGWAIQQPATSATDYLWMIQCNKLGSGIMTTLWSDPVRMIGKDGKPGASLTYRGEWSNTVQYHGTSQLVEAIHYATDGNYYYSRSDAGNIPIGTLPTDTDYWNAFGAQFESVATGLLLAQVAYIEKLIVSTLSTSADNSVAYLKSAGAEIDFWNAGTTDESDKTKALVRVGKDVGYMQALGNNSPGISAKDQTDGSYSEVTSEGVFSNGSNISGLSIATGLTTNTSLAAILQKRNSVSTGISAAILGIDQTTATDGASKSYGGYFSSLFTGELYMAIKTVSDATYNLGANDCYISYYNTVDGGIINLPSKTDLKPGRTFIVKRNNATVQIVTGTLTPWAYIIDHNGNQVLYINIINKGDTWMFVYDGGYWLATPFVAH